jgi:predicted methyltransferase MtxX (methanogen marker protein 4)
MWTFLKMLFLGGTTVLTLHPIDIDEAWVHIEPKEALTAITSGASLFVNITPLVPPPTNIMDRMAAVDRLFPKGCMLARLRTKAGQEIALSNTGAAVSNSATYIHVVAENGVPTDLKFRTVEISATCPVKGVVVSWQNYSE